MKSSLNRLMNFVQPTKVLLRRLLSLVCVNLAFACLSYSQELPAGVIADSSQAWRDEASQPMGGWQHGYYGSGTEFQEATVWREYYPGPESWIGANGRIWDSGGYPRLGKYAMAPSADRKAVRRWTSNFKGEVTLYVDCQQLQNSLNDQRFELYRNGTLEFEFGKAENQHHIVYVEICSVEVGDHLDFVIDSLGNGNADWTHVDIQIEAGSRPYYEGALIRWGLDEENDLPTGWAPHGNLYNRQSRVADFSGQNIHGVALGRDLRQSPSVGVRDKARYFDGVDDLVKTENTGVGNGLSELTLSAWVKPTSKGAREGIWGSSGTDHFGFTFSPTGAGFPIKFSAKELAVVGPDDSCPVGEWTHVVGVWKSGQTLKLFVNGREVAESSSVPGGLVEVTDWIAGSDREIENRFFHGELDELVLFSRALSDQEVSNLHRYDERYDGISGEARYYNGSASDYDVRPLAEELIGAEEITLSAWINPFGKKDNAGIVTSVGEDYFGLTLSSAEYGNPIEFRAKSQKLVGPNYSCPTGQWNHVVGVWKSGEIQKIYLNGVEVASHPSPLSGTINATSWIYGHDRFIPNRAYEGLTDDVVVIPQALTSNEVMDLYRENLEPGHSGPVEMRGYLRWDYRFPLRHSSVNTLVKDPLFYSKPSRIRRFLRGASTGKIPVGRTGSQIRGYIDVEETGEYHFWLSGRDSASFYLSSDETKYNKRLMVELSPDVGTDKGVGADEENLWDVFANQLSEPVFLESGSRYYIELLQANTGGEAGLSPPHVALAWSTPSGISEVIPIQNLVPYVLELEDLDDDFLPDAWEVENGLSASDNGYLSVTKEGERGDFDLDGLNNREEYLLGTNPSNSDTDGDGISDSDEIRNYGSNPLVEDAVVEEPVTVLHLADLVQNSESWILDQDRVVGSTFRPNLGWDLEIPSDGYWIVRVKARLVGNTDYFDIPLSVIPSVDSHNLGVKEVQFRGEVPTSMRFLTQWLKSGTHNVNIHFDNEHGRRNIELIEVSLMAPVGADSNADGIVDWIQDHLEDQFHVENHVLYTSVSPFFIEGDARHPALVDTTVKYFGGAGDKRFNEEQWQNRLGNIPSKMALYRDRLHRQLTAGRDNRMEGEQVQVEEGAGKVDWFAYLPLRSNQITGYVSFSENLGVSEVGHVVWTPLNMLGDDSPGSIQLPVGSSLLLGGWTSKWDKKNVDLVFGDETVTIKANKTYTKTFLNSGEFVVNASHENGTSGSLIVKVRDVTLGGEQNLGRNLPQELIFADVPAEMIFDGGECLNFGAPVSEGEGVKLLVSGREAGRHRFAVRIGDLQGPVIATGYLNVTSISDAYNNGGMFSGNSGIPGYRLATVPLLIKNLPVGGNVKVTIIRGDILFRDGSSRMTLNESDFVDEIYNLQFLLTEDLFGGYCHIVEVFDAEGNLITRH